LPIAREDAERAEMERQRKMAMAPDKIKLAAFIDAINAIPAPQVKSKEANVALDLCVQSIDRALQALIVFSKGK
jgi:hypothetical protein